jgi:hypothetical protein
MITMLRVILGCLLFMSTASCQDPKYGGPEFVQKSYEAIDAFAQAYAKSHDMEFINVGLFADLDKSPLIWGVWLRGFKPSRFAACRKEMTALVQDYWKTIQENPNAKKHFEHRMSKEKRTGVMSVAFCGLKVDYWNKYNNRPPLPFIAQAFFHDGRFYYYQADPETQALILVFEESYEEALSYSKTSTSDQTN